jgi:hypothetical protein
MVKLVKFFLCNILEFVKIFYFNLVKKVNNKFVNPFKKTKFYNFIFLILSNNLYRNIILFFYLLILLYFKFYFSFFIICLFILKKGLEILFPSLGNVFSIYRRDFLVIRYHFKKDFFYWEIFFNISSSILIFCWLYLIFFLDDFYVYGDIINNKNIEESKLLKFMSGYFYFYCVLFFINFFITIYIILYKNTPLEGKLAGICFSCVKGIVGFGLMSHCYASTPVWQASDFANFYNINSPTGTGFGVYSPSQLGKVYLLQEGLGEQFNINEILDENKMVKSSLIKKYAASHKATLKGSLTLMQQGYLGVSILPSLPVPSFSSDPLVGGSKIIKK